MRRQKKMFYGPMELPSLVVRLGHICSFLEAKITLKTRNFLQKYSNLFSTLFRQNFKTFVKKKKERKKRKQNKTKQKKNADFTRFWKIKKKKSKKEKKGRTDP